MSRYAPKVPLNPFAENYTEFEKYAVEYYGSLVRIAFKSSAGPWSDSVKAMIGLKLLEIMASPIRYVFDDWVMNKEVKEMVRKAENTPLTPEIEKLRDEVYPPKKEAKK